MCQEIRNEALYRIYDIAYLIGPNLVGLDLGGLILGGLITLLMGTKRGTFLLELYIYAIYLNIPSSK